MRLTATDNGPRAYVTRSRGKRSAATRAGCRDALSTSPGMFQLFRIAVCDRCDSTRPVHQAIKTSPYRESLVSAYRLGVLPRSRADHRSTLHALLFGFFSTRDEFVISRRAWVIVQRRMKGLFPFFFFFFSRRTKVCSVLTVRSSISARNRASNHVAVVMRVIVLNVLFVQNKPITV